MLKSRIFYFLFTMVVTKLDCKKTDVNCRRSIALTGPDRHRKRVVMGLFQRLAHVHAEFLILGNDVEARRVREYIRRVIEEYVCISTVPNKIFIQFPGERIRIHSAEI